MPPPLRQDPIQIGLSNEEDDSDDSDSASLEEVAKKRPNSSGVATASSSYPLPPRKRQMVSAFSPDGPNLASKSPKLKQKPVAPIKPTGPGSRGPYKPRAPKFDYKGPKELPQTPGVLLSTLATSQFHIVI